MLACVLMASARAGGNTAYAASLIVPQLVAAGYAVRELSLRQHQVLPCLACGFCEKNPGQCFRDAEDEVKQLLDVIYHADLVVICSPIYFYGPSAQMKSLVDRTQKFWFLREAGLAANSNEEPKLTKQFKPALAVYCAGRTKGEQLFTASHLIFNYWLNCLGFKLHSHLGLKALDAPNDLMNNYALQQEILAYATKIITKIEHND